jgi:hypothetical protein
MSSNYVTIHCANSNCDETFLVRDTAARRTYCSRRCKSAHRYHKVPADKEKKLSAYKARFLANPHWKRDQRRYTSYGITRDDFEMRLVHQRGACAICGTWNPGGKGWWHIDHCHDSDRVRGLLCTHCNVGIGMLKDDPAVVASACAYLEKWKGAQA